MPFYERGRIYEHHHHRHRPAQPCGKAGIQVGEQLLTINGHTIVDVLDYRFYGYDPCPAWN